MRQRADIAQLRRHSFFRELSTEEWEHLTKEAQLLQLRDDERFVREGGEGESPLGVYFIAYGHTRSMCSPRGLATMSGRLREAQRIIEDLAFRGNAGRLADLLLAIGDRDGSIDRADYSLEFLASRINTALALSLAGSSPSRRN